jgi:hypothetical protein
MIFPRIDSIAPSSDGSGVILAWGPRECKGKGARGTFKLGTVKAMQNAECRMGNERRNGNPASSRRAGIGRDDSPHGGRTTHWRTSRQWHPACFRPEGVQRQQGRAKAWHPA